MSEIKPAAYMFDWALEKDDVSVSHPEQLALKKVIEPSNVRPLVFMSELEKLQAENDELRLMLSGSTLQIGVQSGRIAQLESQLSTVTSRYNCVRDMTPEDFGNLSSINDDFDSQVDAMIKERSK